MLLPYPTFTKSWIYFWMQLTLVYLNWGLWIFQKQQKVSNSVATHNVNLAVANSKTTHTFASLVQKPKFDRAQRMSYCLISEGFFRGQVKDSGREIWWSLAPLLLQIIRRLLSPPLSLQHFLKAIYSLAILLKRWVICWVQCIMTEQFP